VKINRNYLWPNQIYSGQMEYKWNILYTRIKKQFLKFEML